MLELLPEPEPPEEGELAGALAGAERLPLPPQELPLLDELRLPLLEELRPPPLLPPLPRARTEQGVAASSATTPTNRTIRFIENMG